MKTNAKEARRLLHGRGKCFPNWEQISIDYYPRLLMLTIFHPHHQQQQLCAALLAQWQPHIDGFLVQVRYEKPAINTVYWGHVPEYLVAYENGLAFHVTTQNQNTGLFLDMANGRSWVRENANHKHILNLFAFTCSLSVAAVAGGADQVINMDMNGGVLKRGKENQALNQQHDAKVKYFAHDVLKSMGKLDKQGPYDVIIADPPSFQRGSFELDRDYPKLLRRLPHMLAEGGRLMLCCNNPTLSALAFDEMVRGAIPQAVLEQRLE
ncbi:MAG: class I SAM-dependent methyltransferase, partial [Gammaproteobacteria bacterium]|nr:class I SAM-dependent methyltransferase [Gammaproteobacteria bacterium]